MIKIIDIGNFVVIKGKTTYEKTLDLQLISKEFKDKLGHNFEDMNVNTIDIIEYGCTVNNLGIQITTFY